MQNDHKSAANKKYSTIKNTITETGKKLTNNSFYSLDTENNYEKDIVKKPKNIKNIDVLSVNDIMELKELLKVKDKLMGVVNEESGNYNIITNSYSINNSIYNDIQPQTIYVSRKVFKEFKKFTKEHNTTLKQAVSLALLFYMENFKKK